MNGYSCQITFEDQPVKNNVTRLFNIHDEIVRLTAATPKTLPTRMVKLTGEVGELAGAIDIAEGNAGTKYRNAEEPILDVLEEAIDVDLVGKSLIIQLMQDHGITVEQVLDMYERKLAKWNQVLELDKVAQ